MTILARRFSILCLAMVLFAVGLTIVVDNSQRRSPFKAISLSAPCSQTSGLHCRVSL